MDGTFERLGDLSIFSSEFVESPYIFLEKRRDRIDRFTLLELFGEWMID